MIQPSECLHEIISPVARTDCVDAVCCHCGALVRSCPIHSKTLTAQEIDDAFQNTEAGFGYARGRGWKGPTPYPQKDR